MTRFIRFCLSVILGCIALYCLIHILIIFGYIGFMGWLATSLMSEWSHDKPTPPKMELHRSVKPCPPLSRAPAGTAIRHDCEALGLAKGRAADNSATWGSLFKAQVERCWKKPYGGIESQNPEAAFTIRLKRDGTLEGMPVPEGTPATPYLRVYQESALRAIIECQPYNLPAAFFEEWKYLTPVFTERKI